jgi:hypothetical protein
MAAYRGSSLTLGNLHVWLKGPSCVDGILNGNEVDVDCGGSCGRCAWGVSPAERQALQDLYTSAGGPGWKPVSGDPVVGWHTVANTTNDPCLPTPWTGVTCATGPNRIVYVLAQGDSGLAITITLYRVAAADVCHPSCLQLH